MEENNELLSKKVSRGKVLRFAAGGIAALFAKKASALGSPEEYQDPSSSVAKPELPYRVSLANIASDQEKHPDLVIASDKIMLSESQFPGIIDLLSKGESGEWKQWNNIVPIAQVEGEWSNAEIDKAQINKSIISNEQGLLRVKYEFSPLSNGAHFSLIAELETGKNEAKFSVEVAPDSAPISHFAIGNYYGLKDEVRYVEVNGQVYDALMYEPPKDGNYMLGKFMQLPTPNNGIVEFWGEGGAHQYQKFEELDGSDQLMVEIRRNPWLPSQPSPGHNWFETVHLTRDFASNPNLSITFGVRE